MDKSKILKMTVILAAIVVIASSLGRLANRNSMSLSDYASIHGIATQPEENDPGSDSGSEANGQSESDAAPLPPSESPSPEPDADSSIPADSPPSDSPQPEESILTGASLNGSSQLEQRTLLAEGFYCEPVSDSLRRYITGISYPIVEEGDSQPEITLEELRYVHILHYDFEGNAVEGELICNEYIAQDLLEIFQELYRNEYQIEKVLLIEEYDGDDTASMEDNNTSCFNYRPVEGTGHLSKHAYGLAIDINPLYNPYITYAADGTEKVSPAGGLPFSDRSVSFPYKIDEDDLCYKLFTQHGFTWGGNWNNVKDYQHFQKPLP